MEFDVDYDYEYYEPERDIYVDFTSDDLKFKCKVEFFFSVDTEDFVGLRALSGPYAGTVYPYRYIEYEDGSFEIVDIGDEPLELTGGDTVTYEDLCDYVDAVAYLREEKKAKRLK